MSDTTAIISVVAMLGWLVLAGSALRAHQVGWAKGIRLALIWGSIFLGLFLIAQLTGLSL